MTHRYVRACGGTSCYDAVMTESFVSEGAFTKTIFEVNVPKILASSLREGDIVIMDNLSALSQQERQKRCFFPT